MVLIYLGIEEYRNGYELIIKGLVFANG